MDLAITLAFGVLFDLMKNKAKWQKAKPAIAKAYVIMDQLVQSDPELARLVKQKRGEV